MDAASEEIFPRMASLIRRFPRNAIETAAAVTPASRATSLIVTGRSLLIAYGRLPEARGKCKRSGLSQCLEDAASPS